MLAMLLAAGMSWVDASPMGVLSSLSERMRATVPVRVESTLVLEVRVGGVIESIRPDGSVYVLDGDGRGMLRTDGWVWRVLDRELVIEHQHDDAAYVRQQCVGTPLEALRDQFLEKY